MSYISDQLKTAKRKDMEFFFGQDLKMTSGKYFTFTKFIDNDHIIVLTNNIKFIKNKPVFVVSNNKGIFLKDWQFRKVSSYQKGINCYAVKLTRQYFKPYEFSFEFNDFYFENNGNEFDTWVIIAKEQERENLPVREGWGK